MYTKVHIVFENEYLMTRDQYDFMSYWILLECKEKVSYHIGCSFTPEVGSLVIVDEADTFMLGQPDVFTQFIVANACICFTATPDDGDINGTEAKVVRALKFQKFNYVLDD